ncbi:MAG: sigma-70 family RNA polymerase sigma factor [Acidimicrobiia bacterium]
MDESAPSLVDGSGASVVRSDFEFIEILRCELPRVQRIARLLMGDADAAEDIVAEAIARSLPRWRAGGIADGPAYLRRVVVNLCTRRWRRRALALRRDHLALDWIAPVPDSEAAAAERDRTLRAVLQLPVRRRAVVVLRFYDDLSEATIADVLGISVGTVKSQLSRALGQLREHLGTLDLS